MRWTRGLTKGSLAVAVALTLGGCAMGGGGGMGVPMSGAQEVPPVNAAGSGTGTVSVGADCSVTASIKTTNVAGIAAHIHEGAAGANGPVIVPMQKKEGSNDEWVTAPGAKFTPSQCDSYKAGRTYFNVHTAQNKGGEIRGQINPASGGRAY